MENFHYRNPTSLHKRDPVEDEESINYEEIYNSHKSANIRGIHEEKFLDKLHDPVTFNWSQFWVTFLYENLPPVILSPIAAILIERNKKQAWNVIQNRMLLIFSLNHNGKFLHFWQWLLVYPANLGIHISLFLVLISYSGTSNVDIFHLIIAYMCLFFRNLIISIKYGYFREEDFSLLNKDPPYWNEDRTSRRLVGVGWMEPKKFPGLVEDELICAMDESDVSLKAMSFTTKNFPAEILRNHKTDKLFSAASPSNTSNEVTAAYVVHQILSKIYKNDVSKIYLIIPMSLTIIYILSPQIFGIYYDHLFIFKGWTSAFIYISYSWACFYYAFSILIFASICILDFKRRNMTMDMFGSLIKSPGIKISSFIDSKDDNIDTLKQRFFIDLKIPSNVFSWMYARKVLRNFGHIFYLRIQGYVSVLLCYSIFCVVLLNLIAWMEISHHQSTLFIIIFTIISVSILSIISIIQASNLQHASSSHRNLIRDTIFLVEKSIIENKVFNSYNSLIINSRALLKEVDESIYFDELIHNPTKILGYIASTTVISSALGIILTGLVLALEGFSGSSIAYDINGWFKN